MNEVFGFRKGFMEVLAREAEDLSYVQQNKKSS